jgi:hypothetical protein
VGIVMPFEAAFIDDSGINGWFYLDLINDIVFFLDVFVNMLSAYYNDDGILVTSHR